MHYVVGDVHGCYDEFTALRKKIEKKDPDAVIILTGDLIDRGPKVWEMLRWAMKNITPDGKYQCICGNHEDMVLTWYYEWSEWYADENRKSVARPKASYGFDEVLRENGCDTPEKVRPIMEFFQTLPFRKEVRAEFPDGRVVLFDIVHGADSFDPEISEERRMELNLWGRDGSQVDENTIVVHGHTPTMCYDYLVMDDQVNRPGMIGYQKRDINLDGGCCFSDITNGPCFLCAICLETMEEIYPRMIWSQLMHQGKMLRTRKEAVEEAREFLARYPWKENKYRKEILDMLEIPAEKAPKEPEEPEENKEPEEPEEPKKPEKPGKVKAPKEPEEPEEPKKPEKPEKPGKVKAPKEPEEPEENKEPEEPEEPKKPEKPGKVKAPKEPEEPEENKEPEKTEKTEKPKKTSR